MIIIIKVELSEEETKKLKEYMKRNDKDINYIKGFLVDEASLQLSSMIDDDLGIKYNPDGNHGCLR